MWQSKSFSSPDGVRLFYRDQLHGAGKLPVLCLHGLTRNSRDFEDLAAHLEGRFRVLAADVRGRGQSGRDPEPANYHAGTYVSDAALLLDHAGIERAILIGASMGGLMSMIMGAGMKERVAAIVLNDIGPEIDAAGLDRIRGYVGPSSPAKDWEEARKRMQAINGEALPGLDDAAWDRFTRRLCVETAMGILPAYDPAIAAGVENGSAAPDLWPLWQALAPIPMLVIRGAMSDILSPATLAKMADSHPDCATVTVGNRGHAPLLDEPEAITAIDRFLARFS